MRILVLDTAASKGGAITVLQSLYQHAATASSNGMSWCFVVSDDFLRLSATCPVVVHKLPGPKRSWLSRLWFEWVAGAGFVNSMEPDVVISMQNTLPLRMSAFTVLYVHQPLPFEEDLDFSLWKPKEREAALYQKVIGRLIRRSIARADVVVVQTEWMKDAVTRKTRVDPERVLVIPPALPSTGTYRAHHNARKFIYPSSEAVYKNLDCLIRAAELLAERHVEDVEILVTISRELNGPPFLRSVGMQPRDTLLRLLADSTLVFPSLSETYGLPLLEARMMGCLVLAADRPYAREVLHGYSNAYFFDPVEPAELARLLLRVRSGEIQPQNTADEEVPQNDWSTLESVVNGIKPR